MLLASLTDKLHLWFRIVYFRLHSYKGKSSVIVNQRTFTLFPLLTYENDKLILILQFIQAISLINIVLKMK